MTEHATKKAANSEHERVSLPPYLRKNAQRLDETLIHPDLVTLDFKQHDSTQMLKYSGVVTFQERMRVSDVRRLTEAEIGAQYHPRYVQQLIRQALENAEHLRMPRKRWKKMEDGGR